MSSSLSDPSRSGEVSVELVFSYLKVVSCVCENYCARMFLSEFAETDKFLLLTVVRIRDCSVRYWAFARLKF
jgi:hypothetical protein